MEGHETRVCHRQEKKLLLHAAHRGKTAGRVKFWEQVGKDGLQEHQLEAVLADAVEEVEGPPSQDPTGSGATAAEPKGQKGKGKSPAGTSAPGKGQTAQSRAPAGGLGVTVPIPPELFPEHYLLTVAA